ncbi:MAG TPA: serine/threonine-protein kinase [Thermoanaerobaculia bacterium]|nr:serine/threonine-protein kinase [Thermoanaerobaculia bacterium]
MTDDQTKTARLGTDARTSSHPRQDGAQFAPGTMVAGRYRISSILGAGGMGEVYRADDVKLGQTVALKFLPARLARDPVLLGRLHDEVRVGLQVTHPNVCRVYDIVDWEGAQFVAMEYVDGEDLSRLLRRIGRLAHDKAVDIARGITAGLIAAHAKGILHRDLKPANVMVDARGDARVMDFGLALAAGEDDGTISGTPAYMAPEQLAGAPATVQSDLYSLGLVMYELFTGKRAHNARTLPERRRDTSDITTPSSVIRDIDPAVERIILRCLSNDPAQRPSSAREVINALPGGDPLAAALAAGETPSPRIVAAAGAEGSLKPRTAWTLLGTIALLLTIIILCLRATSLGRYTSLQRSPEVLEQRAADILRTLGVAAAGEPVRQHYAPNAYWSWLRNAEPPRWEILRNGPALIRYRLEYGVTPALSRLTPLVVGSPGWTTIEVDSQARLFFLMAVPATPQPAKPLDWQPLLEASGIDVRSLREIPPPHTPPAPFDARKAWSGTYPGDRMPVRVEAAAWRGTPVYFAIQGPWDERPAGPPLFGGGRGFSIFNTALTIVILALALLLAWRNLRLRRGDRQGAFRVSAAFFLLSATAGVLSLPYASGTSALTRELLDVFGAAARETLLLFLLYIALEPYMRRRWPELLISWNRLVGGQIRDPLVGRHVLIGIIAGTTHAAAIVSSSIIAGWMRDRDYGPLGGRFLSIPEAIARIPLGLAGGLQAGFSMTLLLVAMTMLLRKRALAVAAAFLAYQIFFALALVDTPELLPPFVIAGAVISWVVVRYGLLATAANFAAWLMLSFMPYASAGWNTAPLVIVVTAVVALAVWAFYTSLGGQSPFSASLLDE